MLSVATVAALIVVAAAGTHGVRAESCFVKGFAGTCQEPGLGCPTQPTYPEFCLENRVCCLPLPACDPDPPATGETTVAITSLDSWFSSTVGTNIKYCGLPGQGDCTEAEHGTPHTLAQVRWGRGSSNPTGDIYTLQSGLGFFPKASRVVNLDVDFVVGSFIHYNLVIRAEQIPATTTLNLRMTLEDGQNIDFTYVLKIDETLNVENGCTHTPRGLQPGELIRACPDKIELINGGFSTKTFVLPNSDAVYTLELTGFKQQVCTDSTVFDWITQEVVVNESVLYGRLTRACPESCPGAGFLIYDKGACRCNNVPTATPTVPPPPTLQPTRSPTVTVLGPPPGSGVPPGQEGPPPGTMNDDDGNNLDDDGMPNDDNESPNDDDGNNLDDDGLVQHINPVADPIVEEEAGLPLPAIIGGSIAGVLLLLVLLAVALFLGFKKATTGSFFGAQMNEPDDAIANNPLYHQSGNSGENPLYKS